MPSFMEIGRRCQFNQFLTQTNNGGPLWLKDFFLLCMVTAFVECQPVIINNILQLEVFQSSYSDLHNCKQTFVWISNHLMILY